MRAATIDHHALLTLRFLATKRGKREYQFARTTARMSHRGALTMCARIATGIESYERLCEIVYYLDEVHENAA
jgi:hypothetical protein